MDDSPLHQYLFNNGLQAVSVDWTTRPWTLTVRSLGEPNASNAPASQPAAPAPATPDQPKIDYSALDF
jgi:hypothetical protein